MKAIVYHGPGHKAWEDVPKPVVIDDTDAIVRVDAVTICGSMANRPHCTWRRCGSRT